MVRSHAVTHAAHMTVTEDSETSGPSNLLQKLHLTRSMSGIVTPTSTESVIRCDS